MKSKFLFFFGIFGISTIYAQLPMADSTYIYDQYGIKHWYYIQKDVYCFKLYSETKYTGAINSCVANQSYWANASSKFNEVNFKSSSTNLQRYNQIIEIQNLPDYEMFSIALTKIDTADFTQQKFYRTDDRILITFNDPKISNSEISNFASIYNLELVHQPSSNLPNSVSWTYVFRLIPDKKKTITSIRLAQVINENESILVKLAEPNMYSVEQSSCVPTTEVGLTPGGTNGTWHIRNTGGLIWGGLSGLNDADADICECWGEGYTGAGIKVGIIDFGGIEFTHSDFEGTDIPKAYNALTDMNETSNFSLDPTNGHAMQVTGVVAATPNNTALGQRWAVGSAYNSTVIPYINQIGGATTPLATNEQITISIQKAVEDNVDVINMSFRTNAGLGSIDIQLNNATTVGRPDPNNPSIYLGIVCVAAVGNDDLIGSHFPANLPNVIGVGWTNPEDYRSSYTAIGTGGGWTTNPGQGSTYGPPEYNYDVVAPGELIMTTNLSSAGSSYSVTLGSSFSSPIVASIAAMILEKNPTLTWYEVRDLIRNGADKVHPELYDYNMFSGTPGYNNEMFYGRVSCINSINQTTLSTPQSEKPIQLTIINMGEYRYLIFIPESGENQQYELYDMSGRLLMSGNVYHGETEISVDLSKYSTGMYLLKIYNSQKTITSTKIMK